MRLVRSRFKELPYENNTSDNVIPGCFRCTRKSCVTCRVMVETNTFSSTKTGRKYKVRHQANCRSSWIIYLISCRHPQCGKQYVGKSRNALYKRHYGHRAQFKNKISELGKHFHNDEHGVGNVKIQIIDKVREGNETALEQCEAFWQHQLMTLVENGGLNSQDDLDQSDYKKS